LDAKPNDALESLESTDSGVNQSISRENPFRHSAGKNNKTYERLGNERLFCRFMGIALSESPRASHRKNVWRERDLEEEF